jgi:hypothetical protein
MRIGITAAPGRAPTHVDRLRQRGATELVSARYTGVDHMFDPIAVKQHLCADCKAIKFSEELLR